jgi:hypothetical protein
MRLKPFRCRAGETVRAQATAANGKAGAAAIIGGAAQPDSPSRGTVPAATHRQEWSGHGTRPWHPHYLAMHSVAYNCPVVNLHMIGGIDCDEPTLETMCGAPVSIECPLCGTIHAVRLRRPRRLQAMFAAAPRHNAGA